MDKRTNPIYLNVKVHDEYLGKLVGNQMKSLPKLESEVVLLEGFKMGARRCVIGGTNDRLLTVNGSH